MAYSFCMLTFTDIVNSDVNTEGNICQTCITVVAPFTLVPEGLFASSGIFTTPWQLH